MGYRIVSLRDEEASVSFQLKEDAADMVKINHGPYDLVLKKEDQPFITTEREWEKIFGHLDCFQQLDVEGDQPEQVRPLKPQPSHRNTPIDDVRLEELKYEDAIEEVKRCSDPEWLEHWLTVEKRKTVREAIQERFETLK